MAKFLKLLISLLAISSALLCVTVFLLNTFLFEKSDTLPFKKVERFYSSSEKFNLEILGSSRAEACYIPSILDPAGYAYNFGLSGTGNKIWYYMLLDELQNATSRKIIVNIDRAENPIDSGSDYNYNFYLEVPQSSELYSGLTQETRSSISPIPFYYFGSTKFFLSESLKDIISLTSITDNGYKGKTGDLTEAQFDSYSDDSPPYEVDYDEKKWEDLSEKIASSKDTVFFVFAPVFESHITPNNYTNFKKKISELTHRYSNLYFFDFSESLPDRNLFYDPYHLNHKGATKFTEMLRDSIL